MQGFKSKSSSVGWFWTLDWLGRGENTPRLAPNATADLKKDQKARWMWRKGFVLLKVIFFSV